MSRNCCGNWREAGVSARSSISIWRAIRAARMSQEADGLLASLQQTQGVGRAARRRLREIGDASARRDGQYARRRSRHACAQRRGRDRRLSRSGRPKSRTFPIISRFWRGRPPRPGGATKRSTLYRKAADAGDARAMVSLGLHPGIGRRRRQGSRRRQRALRKSGGARQRRRRDQSRGRPDERQGRREERVARGGAAAHRVARRLGDRDLRSWRSGAGRRRPANPPKRSIFSGNRRALAIRAAISRPPFCSTKGAACPKTPAGAAEELLRGVAGDDGSAFNQLTAKASSWSHDTIKAVQARLKSAGYYAGPSTARAARRSRPRSSNGACWGRRNRAGRQTLRPPADAAARRNFADMARQPLRDRIGVRTRQVKIDRESRADRAGPIQRPSISRPGGIVEAREAVTARSVSTCRRNGLDASVGEDRPPGHPVRGARPRTRRGGTRRCR